MSLRPLPERIGALQPAAAVAAVRRHGKRVVTFAGFGELGYQDEQRVLEICRVELERFESGTTLVNTGTLITLGFRPGITLVYQVACELGFDTVGIHPSVALAGGSHSLSASVNHVYFVEDDSWGGLLSNGRPSPTLEALLRATDELVAIGGGEHTAQEIRTFVEHEKVVRFHPAEMHHATSAAWFARRGVSNYDVRGAAQGVWQAMLRGRDGA
ncbi:MAG TPA: hypothetical protein VG937_31710 [Polyangiaceae bacterium]|nr:hypothetical protein [Polyangiaceae bacterium]